MSVLEEYVFLNLQIFRAALDSYFVMTSLKKQGKQKAHATVLASQSFTVQCVIFYSKLTQSI